MINSNIDLALDGNAEEHLNVFGKRKGNSTGASSGYGSRIKYLQQKAQAAAKAKKDALAASLKPAPAPSKPQLSAKPAITSPKPVITPTDVQIKPKRPAAQGSQTVVPVPSTTVVIGDNASVGTTKSMVADEAGSYAGGGGGGMSSAPSEEAAAEQSTDQAASDEAKKKKKGLMFLLIAGGAIALIMFSGKK